MQQTNHQKLTPEQEQEKRILLLEQQLNESVSAENLFNTASGKLIVKILTEEVTRLTRQLISEKFLKDHVGYVNCVMELKANEKLLRKLQAAGSSERMANIREQLEQYGE